MITEYLDISNTFVNYCGYGCMTGEEHAKLMNSQKYHTTLRANKKHSLPKRSSSAIDNFLNQVNGEIYNHDLHLLFSSYFMYDLESYYEKCKSLLKYNLFNITSRNISYYINNLINKKGE